MSAARDDALLNGRQCAESIGISQQAFLKWKVPVAKTKGRQTLYALQDVLVVYRDRCRRELEKEVRQAIRAESASGDDPDGASDDWEKIKLELDIERTRLTRAQADAQELKNEMARHEVAPFGFVTFLLGKVANEIAGVMDSLPVELMRKLSLKPHDVDKVKGVTALAADAIVSLGDVSVVEQALDEFIAQAD